MSNFEREQYEISIWEDYSLQTDNGVEIEERKIAVIGSNEMDDISRAFNPRFSSNMNQVKSLSFDIYQKYRNEDGELVANPFAIMIQNETKIKLKFRGEWHDFVVKNIVEDSYNYTLRVQCKDLHTHVLSRIGYDVEFDIELENNIGTLQELAETAFNNTEWEVLSGGEVFRERKEEPVYEVLTSGAFSGYLVTDTDKTPHTIPTGSTILVFHSDVMNFEEGIAQLQFVYSSTYSVNRDLLVLNEDSNYVVEGIAVTTQTIGGQPTWVVKIGSNTIFTLEKRQSLSNDYRANKYIQSQHIEYDAKLGRYVKVYTRNGSERYGYTETTYQSPLTVRDLITNGKNFLNTVGWSPANKVVFKTYQSSTGIDSLKSYLFAKMANGEVIQNSGIRDRANYLLDGLVKGEKLIVRAKVQTGTDTVPGNDLVNGHLTMSISGGTYVSSQTSGGYHVWSITVPKTYSYSELVNNEAILRIRNTQSTTNYWIEEIQLFKEVLDSNNNRIIPGAIDVEPVVQVENFFYDPTQSYSTKEDIVYESKDPSLYTPKFDGSYEKRRSVTISKSNLFNIAQELAEKFECWAVLKVTHDVDGKITNRAVQFTQKTGTRRPAGFVYGLDLQGIERTVDSDQISTKVIVEPNQNELSEYGYCSIAEAPENYSGENFIYNFNYYVQKGLIPFGQLQNDLYASDANLGIGLITRLHIYNKERDLLITKQGLIRKNLTELKADKSFYENSLTAAKNQSSELFNKLVGLSGKSTLAGIQTWLANGSVEAKNIYTQYREVEKIIDASEALVQNRASSLTQEENRLKTTVTDLKTNFDAKKDLVNLFNSKYYRFIQEGVWTSPDYYDNNMYYFDALSVSNSSAFPKIQYSIKVTSLAGLEEFKGKFFNVGDITTIEDTEYFGYVSIGGVKTPYKEEILVTEMTYNLDQPELDEITVQNYRPNFEELFQRITATTQSLELAQGGYERAARAITPQGTIALSVLQHSLTINQELVYSSNNSSYVQDHTGITMTDLNNTKDSTRYTPKGLFFTQDGGITWNVGVTAQGVSTSALTAGIIYTDNIVISQGGAPTFRWDNVGLTAYKFGSGGLDPSTFVRHDQYGFYGVTDAVDDNDEPGFIPTSEDEIWDKAKFALTWRGFLLQNKRTDGYVRITSEENEPEIVVGTTKQVGGDLVHQNRVEMGRLASDLYGLRLKDGDGSTVLDMTSDGDVALTGILKIASGLNNVAIGQLNYDGSSYGDTTYLKANIQPGSVISENTLYTYDSTSGTYIYASPGVADGEIQYYYAKKAVLNANDDFIVFEDGSLLAENGYFKGHIEATSGSFSGHIEAQSGSFIGLVEAAGGSFTGTIYAADGQIGNTTIKPDGLEIRGGDFSIIERVGDNPLLQFKKHKELIPYLTKFSDNQTYYTLDNDIYSEVDIYSPTEYPLTSFTEGVEYYSYANDFYQKVVDTTGAPDPEKQYYTIKNPEVGTSYYIDEHKLTISGKSEFEGRIVASSGTIANLNIGEKSIYVPANTIRYEMVEVAVENPAAEDLYETSDGIVFTKTLDVVAEEGKAYYRIIDKVFEIDSRGKLTAMTGSIGGIEIQTDGLASKNFSNDKGFFLKDTGEIIANSILLGDFAKIQNYLKLGDNTYLFNSDYISTEIGKGIGEVLRANRISFYDDGTAKFGNIDIDGSNSSIYTNGSWSLTPELASFSNISASGKISSVAFETNTIQGMGGHAIFKHTASIISSRILENSLQVSVDATNVGYFNSGDIVLVDGSFSDFRTHNKAKVDATNVVYKYTLSTLPVDAEIDVELYESIDGSYVLTEDTLILENKEYFYKEESHLDLVISGVFESDFIPRIIVNIGPAQDDNWVIGVNAGSTRFAGLLEPNSITFSSAVEAGGNLNYIPRIVLGELGPSLGFSGKTNGLYAESAHLTGSLTTRTRTDEEIQAKKIRYYAYADDENGTNFSLTDSNRRFIGFLYDDEDLAPSDDNSFTDLPVNLNYVYEDDDLKIVESSEVSPVTGQKVWEVTKKTSNPRFISLAEMEILEQGKELETSVYVNNKTASVEEPSVLKLKGHQLPPDEEDNLFFYYLSNNLVVVTSTWLGSARFLLKITDDSIDFLKEIPHPANGISITQWQSHPDYYVNYNGTLFTSSVKSPYSHDPELYRVVGDDCVYLPFNFPKVIDPDGTYPRDVIVFSEDNDWFSYGKDIYRADGGTIQYLCSLPDWGSNYTVRRLYGTDGLVFVSTSSSRTRIYKIGNDYQATSLINISRGHGFISYNNSYIAVRNSGTTVSFYFYNGNSISLISTIDWVHAPSYFRPLGVDCFCGHSVNSSTRESRLKIYKASPSTVDLVYSGNSTELDNPKFSEDASKILVPGEQDGIGFCEVSEDNLVCYSTTLPSLSDWRNQIISLIGNSNYILVSDDSTKVMEIFRLEPNNTTLIASTETPNSLGYKHLDGGKFIVSLEEELESGKKELLLYSLENFDFKLVTKVETDPSATRAYIDQSKEVENGIIISYEDPSEKTRNGINRSWRTGYFSIKDGELVSVKYLPQTPEYQHISPLDPMNDPWYAVWHNNYKTLQLCYATNWEGYQWFSYEDGKLESIKTEPLETWEYPHNHFISSSGEYKATIDWQEDPEVWKVSRLKDGEYLTLIQGDLPDGDYPWSGWFSSDERYLYLKSSMTNLMDIYSIDEDEITLVATIPSQFHRTSGASSEEHVIPVLDGTLAFSVGVSSTENNSLLHLYSINGTNVNYLSSAPSDIRNNGNWTSYFPLEPQHISHAKHGIYTIGTDTGDGSIQVVKVVGSSLVEIPVNMGGNQTPYHYPNPVVAFNGDLILTTALAEPPEGRDRTLEYRKLIGLKLEEGTYQYAPEFDLFLGEGEEEYLIFDELTNRLTIVGCLYDNFKLIQVYEDHVEVIINDINDPEIYDNLAKAKNLMGPNWIEVKTSHVRDLPGELGVEPRLYPVQTEGSVTLFSAPTFRLLENSGPSNPLEEWQRYTWVEQTTRWPMYNNIPFQTYAGVNTISGVPHTKVLNDDSKIVFWAGSVGDSPTQIQASPFQVTERGTLYAQYGYFEQSVFVGAEIDSALIRTARIEGSGNLNGEPALIIASTEINQNGGGISIQRGNTETMMISQGGINLKEGKIFVNSSIIIDENKTVYPTKIEMDNGRVKLTQGLNDQNFSISAFSGSDLRSEMTLSGDGIISFKADDTLIMQMRAITNDEGEIEANSNFKGSVNMSNNLTLGEIGESYIVILGYEIGDLIEPETYEYLNGSYIITEDEYYQLDKEYYTKEGQKKGLITYQRVPGGYDVYIL